MTDYEHHQVCTALGVDPENTLFSELCEQARAMRLALHRAQARVTEAERVRDAIQRDSNIRLEQSRAAVEAYKVCESRLLVRTAELDDVRDLVEKLAIRLGVNE